MHAEVATWQKASVLSALGLFLAACSSDPGGGPEDAPGPDAADSTPSSDSTVSDSTPAIDTGVSDVASEAGDGAPDTSDIAADTGDASSDGGGGVDCTGVDLLAEPTSLGSGSNPIPPARDPSVAAVGDRMFWVASSGTGTAGDAIVVTSKSAGTTSTFFVGSAYDLASDGVSVFWTNSVDGKVRSCPVAGCTTPTVIAYLQAHPSRITIDGTSVLYVTDSGTMRCAKSGCADSPTLTNVPLAKKEAVVANGEIYFLGSAGGIQHCPLSDCTTPKYLVLADDTYGTKSPSFIGADATDLYWTSAAPGLGPGRAINVRCALTGCAGTPTIINTLGAVSSSGSSFIGDGTDLYYLAPSFGDSGRNYGVYKIPRDGGTLPTRVMDVQDASRMVVDGERIYVFTRGSGVRSCSKCGCQGTPTQLTFGVIGSPVNWKDIAVLGDLVIWEAVGLPFPSLISNELWSCPVTGCADGPTRRDGGGGYRGFDASHFIVDGAKVYGFGTDPHMVLGAGPGGHPAGTITVVPGDFSAEPTTLYTTPSAVTALAASAGWLYWVDPGMLSTTTSISKMPIAGGPLTPLATVPTHLYGSYSAVVASNYYFAQESSGVLSVVPGTGGTPTTVVTEGSTLKGVTTDGTALYWFGAGYLRRQVPGSAATTLSTADVSAATVVGSKIYYVADGLLVSQPVTGGTPTKLAGGMGGVDAITVAGARTWFAKGTVTFSVASP